MKLSLNSRTFVVCPLLVLVISLPAIENVPVPQLDYPTNHVSENPALEPPLSSEDAIKVPLRSSNTFDNTNLHGALRSSVPASSHFSSTDPPNFQNNNLLIKKETLINPSPLSSSGNSANGQQNVFSSTSKSALKDASGLPNTIDNTKTQSAVQTPVTSSNSSAPISNDNSNKNPVDQHEIYPNSQSMPISPSTKAQNYPQPSVPSSTLKPAMISESGLPIKSANTSTHGALNSTLPAAASLVQQETSSNTQKSFPSSTNSNVSSSTTKSTTPEKKQISPSSSLVNPAQEEEPRQQQASPQSSSSPKSPPKVDLPASPGQVLGGNDGDIQKENGGEVEDDGSNELPSSGGERPETDGLEEVDDTQKTSSTKGEVAAADGGGTIPITEQRPIQNKEQTPSDFSPNTFREPDRNSFSGEVSHRGDYNPEDENVGVFSYFLTFVVICGVGFFMLHHRKRIIAMLLEGRRPRAARSRRSSSSGSYRKLENNFD